MDSAYDHIQEEAYRKQEDDGSTSGDKLPDKQLSLNTDLQEAYRALSTSPWAARIRGFLGNVVKQVEPVYREAQQELTDLSQDASRGLNDLLKRTRSMPIATVVSPTSQESDTGTTSEIKEISLDEALSESETVLSRLRGEAAKRLKNLQKAEDAADDALLRFGSNLRDFLKDAIKIASPKGERNQSSTVLFESKDAQGMRVIHTSRFDAQLHVIHTTTDNFVKNPSGTEYEAWNNDFDIGKKTNDISGDLSKYPELRATMESLVPEQISYADFWTRYYFLRHSIETAEARRRDLLQAASTEDEVEWDDDDSDDEAATISKPKTERPGSSESSTTIHPPPRTRQTHLKPAEPRKSNDEKSQADSDASYDVVGAASGVASQAPNSPKELRKDEDSDEDWE